jgi:hypothetical protein
MKPFTLLFFAAFFFSTRQILGQTPRKDGFGVNVGAIYGHVRLGLVPLNQVVQIRVNSHGGFTFGTIYHKQLSQRVRIRS